MADRKLPFDNYAIGTKDMIDKGKLFERMGRKTTGLSNGGWVTEVIYRVAIAHSFRIEKMGFCF